MKGIPDLRYINRKVSIREVARALDLRFGPNGNVHCWRPELHQNEDRTASVGIWTAVNKMKCFGCGVGPLGPVDLVMSVIGMTNPGAAGRWIAQRFSIPDLPPGRRPVAPERHIAQFGHESDVGVLILSGLWAQLSPHARSLVPVLLELAERDPKTRTLALQISYRALQRFSGVSSPNAVANALRELQEIQWLTPSKGQRTPGGGPVRNTSTYIITPRSDALMELAHATVAEFRRDIEEERKLRAEERERRRTLLTK